MKFVLNSNNLTIEQAYKIATSRDIKIEIAEEAIEQLEKTRELVFRLADKGVPIYGFTTGVGWNKDKQIFEDYFEEYNRNLIYAHCLAVDPILSEEKVRAVMLARLNALLSARTGIQIKIVEMYRDFLNHGIHPVIPARGSVGAADITNLSHIGLAMIGEGDVFHNGNRIPAIEALKKEGFTPIILGPKDGLAIVSSNALAAGTGALVLEKAKNLLEVANAVYALSVEGLDGNITPIRPEPNEARKMKSQIRCADAIRKLLEGSYLQDKGITKTVQDPLSFRGAHAINATILDSLNYVCELLTTQLNSSDDNPCVVLEKEEIISCSNFEVANWVLGFEMLGQAVAHVARSACHRTIKLCNPHFTKLPRFLSPDEGKVQAYQTIQKTFTSLDGEIRHLMNPASTDYYSLSGDMEDHATNAPYVVEKTEKIIDDAFYILGLEAMHAAQAVDLRKVDKMGVGSKCLYDAIRSRIPFLEHDRPLTPDIKAAYEVVCNQDFIDKLKLITGGF
ncbi:HAL/PAL/TAL family ammonia-lyase [Maledivibacter halophilus]|uniref:Histidine ammonia-lyase n=1 Tax=Maledivibacter halophilus TaxID=36842 RepID=A0A1T5KZP2_9FIRM|nr:aromatic amino acid ammonia-lyase [Maledivibacter halophilus]SKC69247.1 histidine ammonia-lyase [Maledivibacter halophilus]